MNPVNIFAHPGSTVYSQVSLPLLFACISCQCSALFKKNKLCHRVSGDLTGQVLAYISLIPIAILVGFVTLIVFKRELHTVSSVYGVLVLS